MNKTRCFAWLSLLFTNFSTLMHAEASHSWAIEARDWVNTYIISVDGSLTVSEADLQLTLNLLYLSYARSQTTLLAQEQSLIALETVWHATQNIIQTRRNPSKEIPYPAMNESWQNIIGNLEKLHNDHIRVGSTYAAALELIINGSLITDSHVKEGIQDFRHQARLAMLQALTNVKTHLNAILNMRSSTVKKHIKSIINHIDKYVQQPTKNFKITDFIWGLMPGFALKSFVKADTITIMLSEKWWNAQIQLLKLSNTIWKSLETARAHMYLDYYKATYAAARQAHVDPQIIACMFKEEGLLEPEKRTIALPDPATLTIPS